MLSSYPRKFSLSGLTWGLWPCGGQPTSRQPCRRAAVRREGYHMATHVKPRENFLRWYKTARSLHLGRLGCYRVLTLVVVIDYTWNGGIDIRHYIIAAASNVVCIMIEGVGLVAGLNDTGQPMHRHIHQAELCVILHLLLSVEGHGLVRGHALAVYEIAALDKHTATATGNVRQRPGGGLQNIHDHFLPVTWA